MPTISDLHVDATAASGVLASSIAQDTALLLTQAPAADESDVMADAYKGPADACPSALNIFFDVQRSRKAC